MSKNEGKKCERIFVESIKGKKVCEVSKGFRDNLERMFKGISDDDVIAANLIEGYNKADFYVEINGVRKNLSLKTGLAKEVGEYDIKGFVSYLRQKGISEETLKTIVLLHFCDGTLDNTGPVRYDVNTFKKRVESRISKANAELNENKDLIKDFVYLVVFKGFYEGNVTADYIYFGTQDHGYCCNYRQTCRMIDSKKWAYIQNLHIGPIQFRPGARYSNTEVRDVTKRWKVRFYWVGLEVEIERIGSQFRYQHDGYIPLAERKEITKGE